MVPSPLALWLTEYEVPVLRFAHEARLSKKTVYNLINGSKIFRADTLLAVQAATGNEVTINEMMDWLVHHGKVRTSLRRHRPRRARKQGQQPDGGAAPRSAMDHQECEGESVVTGSGADPGGEKV